jgi:hypothetical protein
MSDLGDYWDEGMHDVAPAGVRPDGCLPRTDRCGDVFPVLEDSDVVPLIPRDQWPQLAEQSPGLEGLVRKIKNQKSEGTCAGNATTQAAEVCWNMTFGLQAWLEFSPIAIYRWIASGPDTGSVISDNLRQLQTVGALPVSSQANITALKRAGLNAAHVLTETGYYQQFPADWKDTAALFQGVEAFDIASIDGFVSALLAGFPVVAGRRGHAICYVRLVLVNGVLKLKYANSWGEWGDEGYGYDSLELLAANIGSYGAWALRSVRIDRPEIIKLIEGFYGTA